MNDLYFSVKDSTWKAEKPTAYYMDDICEFIVCSDEFKKKEGFIRDFITPLMDIYRKKYDLITNKEAADFEEDFIMELPYNITRGARPALLWYMKTYPDGEYIETARDFSKAISRSEEICSPIIIYGK
jgi:hypothetical protein